MLSIQINKYETRTRGWWIYRRNGRAFLGWRCFFSGARSHVQNFYRGMSYCNRLVQGLLAVLQLIKGPPSELGLKSTTITKYFFCLKVIFELGCRSTFKKLNLLKQSKISKMVPFYNLRNANCACWELFSINFTGVAGALCARDCRVNVFCFITSIFYSNSLKKQKCLQGSPLVKPIFLYCKSFYFEINHFLI